MKVLVYDTKKYDREFLDAANRGRHELTYSPVRLNASTAALADGFPAVSCFVNDDTFARLMTFPNVLVTGHQAFFTREALTEIAETTIQNITCFEEGRTNQNMLKPMQA